MNTKVLVKMAVVPIAENKDWSILDGLDRNWVGYGGTNFAGFIQGFIAEALVWMALGPILECNHCCILDVLGENSIGYGADLAGSIFLHLYFFFNSDPDLQNNQSFDFPSCGFWMALRW